MLICIFIKSNGVAFCLGVVMRWKENTAFKFKELMVFKITRTSMLIIPINGHYKFEIRVDQKNIPLNSDIQIKPSKKNVFNEMSVNFKFAFLQKQAQSQVWIRVIFSGT